MINTKDKTRQNKIKTKQIRLIEFKKDSHLSSRCDGDDDCCRSMTYAQDISKPKYRHDPPNLPKQKSYKSTYGDYL